MIRDRSCKFLWGDDLGLILVGFLAVGDPAMEEAFRRAGGRGAGVAEVCELEQGHLVGEEIGLRGVSEDDGEDELAVVDVVVRRHFHVDVGRRWVAF